MSSFPMRLINYKLCECCSECFAGCNSLIIRSLVSNYRISSERNA